MSSIVVQENIPVENLLKSFNIRDAIVYLQSSWDELPQRVLVNAFKKIKNWDETNYEREDDLPLSQLFPSNRAYNKIINEAQTLLEKISGEILVDLQEIEEWNEDPEEQKEDDRTEGEDIVEINDTDYDDESDEVKEVRCA